MYLIYILYHMYLLQGLNSGVALYHLERMRSSLVYREELTRERMAQLSDKYLPSPDWSLGDQVQQLLPASGAESGQTNVLISCR